MSELKIAGNPLPGMPWEERPEGCKNVMWRCSANPIIPRDLLPTSNSIFNSAVVPSRRRYAGVFRMMIQTAGIPLRSVPYYRTIEYTIGCRQQITGNDRFHYISTLHFYNLGTLYIWTS